MTNSENIILKKHVYAVHSTGRSLIAAKFANILLRNAYDDLLTKETHEISLVELRKLSGCNSRNLKYIKSALTTLIAPITWNLLGKGGEEIEWSVASFVSKISIKPKTGMCYYRFDKDVRELLYQPSIYTKINLNIQKKFKSKFSLNLYQNCLRYIKVGTTGFIDVKTWRELLGVAETQYVAYPDFSRQVLLKAIKEINEVSDIYIKDIEYDTCGRKVLKVKLILSLNLENISNPLIEKTHKKQKDNKDYEVILDRLIKYKISKTKAELLIKDHSLSIIASNIEYVEKIISINKNIRNIPGYIIKAITENMVSNVQSTAENHQQKIAEKHLKEQINNDLELQKQEENKLEIANKERLFKSLSPGEKSKIIDDLTTEHKDNPLIMKAINKGNYDSTMIKMLILNKIKET